MKKAQKTRIIEYMAGGIAHRPDKKELKNILEISCKTLKTRL